MGHADPKRVFTCEEMAKGDVMFAATGVTSGAMLRGVRIRGQGAITHSVVMRSRSGTVRYIEAHHNFSTKTGRGWAVPQVMEPVLGVARSLSGRRWVWRVGEDRVGLGIAQRLGVPEIVGRLLAARGIGIEAAATSWIRRCARCCPIRRC